MIKGDNITTSNNRYYDGGCDKGRNSGGARPGHFCLKGPGDGMSSSVPHLSAAIYDLFSAPLSPYKQYADLTLLFCNIFLNDKAVTVPRDLGTQSSVYITQYIASRRFSRRYARSMPFL